ncbi:MAG TPA: YihY/virulence factor BrkB family protein [Parachlamydiaceae bacterium]|nr:YihY/virulence factor BrkB family protein [Parachlamydiaceae bacterium]
MKFIKKIKGFFEKVIWKKKGLLYSLLRVLSSSITEFINKNGFDKASVLTFYTLLTIIPLFAIAFGIAQAFGFAEMLEQQIKEYFASQPQVADKLIEFSNSTLKSTLGGVIASLGLITLFWTVLKTIGNLEDYFNGIWETSKPRTLLKRTLRYTPIILLFPFFLVGPSSAVIFSIDMTQNIAYVGPIIKFLFSFASYVISWAFLSFLYIYLPNKKIPWKEAFLGALFTTIIFYIWQWFYITFQVQAASYGAIYGGFAALPLFLLWLNYSWMIILFGARLTREINIEAKR